MSASSATTLPRDFWAALARLGATGAPGLAWENQAGPDFLLLAPFLRAANAGVCRAVPCPECGAARRISTLPDGSFTMEQGEHCVKCEERHAIPRAHVTPTRLSAAAFALAVATVLKFEAAKDDTPGILLNLGTLVRGIQLVPVALVLGDNPHNAQLQLSLSQTPAPAALILAVPAPALVADLRRRGYWVFPAATILQPKPKGAFRGGKSLTQLLAEQQGGVPMREARDPLPMRGKRYEIAEGFVAVTKLGKKPVRFEITQPMARALLCALVDSGAGSEKTAIEKGPLLSLTYQGGTAPDIRPSQLLRHTTAEGTKPLPFRDDILRHSRTGGLYWLEL